MYKIYCDSGCDLTLTYAAERNINIVPLTYFVDGAEYSDDGKDAAQLKVLYDQMREGKNTSTSQPLQETMYSIFEECAKAGDELIYMTLSSGISATYSSALVTRERCLEEYPDAKIAVIDSLCACGGYGLLMEKIADNRDNGMSFEDAVDWIEEHKHNIIHWFTVDDLVYLQRGGRVSKAKAAISGILNIKPILHVDATGHLVNVGTARGRRNSLKELCKRLVDDIEEYNDDEQIVYVNHADAKDDIDACINMISECPKVKQIRLNNVGPTIGSHSGPGTIAIFCTGNKREK